MISIGLAVRRWKLLVKFDEETMSEMGNERNGKEEFCATPEKT